MLQQTQVKTTIEYYFRFVRQFPDIVGFAGADIEQVLKIWEGLGYYARARNFHNAARQVVKKYKGFVPDNYNSFIQLPGVGDYIASAVQSIAFGSPHAVVDGNVKRVFSRLFLLNAPVNQPSQHKVFKKIAQDLLLIDRPGMFNQAVMELGALVCSPKSPRCQACPVFEFCKAFERSKTDLYPKRLASKKIPTYQIAVGIVSKNKKVLITKRKANGLLGGLWEFPGGKQKKGETAQYACIREIKEETGLDVDITGFLTSIKHAYTHFKIQLSVYYCKKKSGRVRLNGPVDFKWVSLKKLDTFAFPGANRKFIPLIDRLKLS